MSTANDRILALLLAGANANSLSAADVEELLAQAEADAAADAGLVGLLEALRQQLPLQQLQGQQATLQEQKAMVQEQEAVLQLVESLRAAEPVQLELTNYRKDGRAFRNLLSLRPVHDSNGRYRYCIGVLADADALGGSARDE